MAEPKGKPSDQSPLGMSWDALFKLMIKVVGGMQALAGLLLLVGQKAFAGVLIIIGAGFAICSKDNPKITSSVAAINREKKDRVENFFN